MEFELNKKYEIIQTKEINNVEREFFIYKGKNKNIFESHLSNGVIISAEYCDDFDGDLDLEVIKQRVLN